MAKMPRHSCDSENPCPVLVGICEGPDPKNWKRPAYVLGVTKCATCEKSASWVIGGFGFCRECAEANSPESQMKLREGK